MSEASPYTALLFASFGGPEKQEDVLPFLRNVTRGRGIPDERLEEVATHYRALGGKSPINDQNKDLIARLEVELQERGIDLPVYWGNRNWEPYVGEVAKQMLADGHHRVLGFATSAYSSYSSCRQYLEDFSKALNENELVGQLEIDKLRIYYNHPGFLHPIVDWVKAAIQAHAAAGHSLDEIELLFSTHSIPTAMADHSGPKHTWQKGSGGWYVAQHKLAMNYIMEQVNSQLPALLAEHLGDQAATASAQNFQLVYQSRSGAPHIPWLEPDINDVIEELQGRKAVIVVPFGFVTDHVEVIWDLDTEAKQTAEALGLDFIRVPTSGQDPRFIAAIADLIEERITPGFGRQAVIDLPGQAEHEAQSDCELDNPCCLLRAPEAN